MVRKQVEKHHVLVPEKEGNLSESGTVITG